MDNLYFYLPQLDVSVNSLLGLVDGSTSIPFVGDATVEVDIPLVNAMYIFQFYTDSNDINNNIPTDIKYKVLYTGDGSYNMIFNIDTSSNVIGGSIHNDAANNNTTYDYVRYLAKQLFGTHLGSSLFINETQLRENLRDSFSVAFNSNMTNLSSQLETDASGNSPTKIIISQMINTQPSRFNNINNVSVGDNWFKSPFILNDVLYFRLKVNAANDQNNLTGVSPISSRTYLIRATLK